MLWQKPKKSDPLCEVELPFEPIRQAMTVCKAHSLWIPGCCYAMGSMTEPAYRGTHVSLFIRCLYAPRLMLMWWQIGLAASGVDEEAFGAWLLFLHHAVQNGAFCHN